MNNITNEAFIECYEKHYKKGYGFRKLIADELGIHGTTVTKKINFLQKNGLIALDSGNRVQEGTILRKVATYHHGDKELGIPAQWISADVAKEEALLVYKEIIEDMVKQVEGKAKPVPTPKINDDDLLSFYPLPDLHFGLLVDKNDSNHDYHYDLNIAERWVKASMTYLVDSAPNSKEAVICDLGDFLHAENSENRTKSGHALDVDGRNPKIVRIAFEIVKQLIEMTLTKHEIVHVYSIPGNHSEQSGIFLKEYLAAWFRNEPRVKIYNQTHASQQYHSYGQNILGFSHGHELRPERAAEVLVFDNQAIFSSTLYRTFHFGHFHQNKTFETPLCNIEIHKNIIPRDAWAEGMGFRGHIGQAKSITYHKEYGEIGRNVFNIRMMEK